MADQKAIARALRENASKPFVDRITNPQNYEVINNPDGSVSTHKMAAEIDENGQAWAFPTIVQTPEGLNQFDNTWEAMKYNIENENAIRFNSIDEALDFSINYKNSEFKNYYKNKR
jgi:hypothetical protein|tara:strand:- start:19913 stop:20260 length:348 start_codon:yes stop_codon:yes gene_type:complete